MGAIQSLLDRLTRRSKYVATQETGGQIRVNALCSNYENLFAQVRPLINEMKVVRPYGVGRNGGVMSMVRTPELAVLANPNKDMGWSEFIDDVLATWLTEEEVNIHVWRDDRGNVFGYSRLPVNSRTGLKSADGFDVFQVLTENNQVITYTSEDVMTLRFSRSPRDITKGVSPATSVEDYAQLDDVIGQFEKAWFENGAVPSSITIIRASTKEKYTEVRKDLEKNYHGAKNKNKTLYLWRQFNPANGDEVDQVEVKPIQANNSTMAIKEIVSIVNDKLNKSVGVSEFMLGNDSSAKYDNAELSQQLFLRNRVFPALMAFWDQFQHELDRITGGLGYGIQFDLEIPELTEQAKAKAEVVKIKKESRRVDSEIERIEEETRRIEEDKRRIEEETRKIQDESANLRRTGYTISLDAITRAINAGATAEATLKALNLGDEWLDLARGIELRAQGQNSTLSSANTNGGVQNLAVTDTVPCAIHSHDSIEEIQSEFTPNERKVYDELMKIVDAIAEQNPEIPYDEVKQVVLETLQAEANLGANETGETVATLLKDKDPEAVASIMEALKNGGYAVDSEFLKRLEARTDALVERFSEDVQAEARTILAGSGEVTAQEMKKQLTTAGFTRQRATLIARNETVNAMRAGQIANADALEQQFGVKLAKVWRTANGSACAVCQAMDGQHVAIHDSFEPQIVEVPNKDGLTSHLETWATSVWNNDGETPNAHVNCRCTFDLEVVE